MVESHSILRLDPHRNEGTERSILHSTHLETRI